MAALAFLPIWAIWRFLPEPERGSQSWLKPGERNAEAAAHSQHHEDSRQSDANASEVSKLQETMLAAHIEPRSGLILHEDPTQRSIWWIMRYLSSPGAG